MLADTINTLAIDRAATEAHHKMYLGGDNNAGYSRPEAVKADDMNLGEITTVHNYHTPPQKKGGGIAKAILGAGLLATGVGLPFGALLIADALKDRPAPQPAPSLQDTDTDTNTQYELRLVD